MKRDFSQPFHSPKPTFAYVLAEYPATGQFLLLKVVADEFGDEWHTVPSFELPEGEDTARLLAQALDRYGLVLESFREVARDTKVTYSLVDDTPGEQQTYVCLYAQVEPARPYKSDDTVLEFVSLDRLLELSHDEMGDLPTIIGLGAATIDGVYYAMEAAKKARSEASPRHITNVTIFDRSNIDHLIEPFVPGMSRYITPIKYEALSPDMYCLLFRTTKDGRDYYFVLLEYDYIPTLEDANHIITKWHGKTIEFLPPQGADEVPEKNLNAFSYAYNKIYHGLLARVERPTGDGYWAAQFMLHPGDDVDAALAHLSERQQTAIKRGLSEIKSKHAAISIYPKPEGGYDLFFG